MRFILLTILALSVACADKNKWGVEDADGVSVMTKDNFDDFIKTHKFVFVKFFAPWCGHCKKMAPSYSALAKKFNESGKDVVIAELDATIHGDIATRYGIRGYPTLKFFFHGEPMDYQGEREGDAIESWIEKKLTTKVEEITTKEKMTEVSNAKLAVVLYAKELSNTIKNRFTALAGSYDKIAFYISTCDCVKDFLHAEQNVNLVIFRSFDDGKKTLGSQNDWSLDEMKTFLDNNRFASVMDFDEEAAQTIFGNQKTAIFYFSDKEDSEGLKVFTDIAGSKKFELTFSKSTITTGLGHRLAEYIGIADSDEGAVRIIKFAGQDLQKFKLTKALTKENLEEFIQSFTDGKLTAYRKSEKPIENDTADVKTITGDDFDQRVLNNDQYVLLEIYAPWCGHCKQLAPIYEKLAKAVKGNNKLVIAKFDGTANEHPDVQAKGFPTIKFFKKGAKKNPVDYAGGREYNDFIDFLKKEMGDDWVDAGAAVSEDL